jgi:hypothetical protein
MLTRMARIAPAAVLALALAGCDSVEYHGKIFDAMGLTNKPQPKPTDVQTVAPLVIPPTSDLPPPAEKGVAGAGAPQAWPNDPDQQAKIAQTEEQKKLQEYYDKGDFSGKGGIDEFNKLSDPLARRPGIFGSKGVADRLRENSAPPPQ